MKQPRLLIQSLIIVLLASMSLMPMMAQDDDETEDEIVFAVCGEVEFVDDEIVVDGINIAPAGSFNPSELEEGDIVGLTGTLLNDETLKASSLTELEDIAECESDDESGDEGEEGDDEEDNGDDESDNCEVVDDGDETGDDETGDDEAGDDEAGDDETSDECADEEDEGKQHPIARILSEEFDLEYDEVMAWHDEGLGFGEIARALLLADQVEDVELQDIFDALADGEGWGEILRDYDISPSALAPGRVISGRYNPGAESSGDEVDAPGRGNGRGNGNGNANGNGNGRGNGNANGRGNGNGNGRGG